MRHSTPKASIDWSFRLSERFLDLRVEAGSGRIEEGWTVIRGTGGQAVVQEFELTPRRLDLALDWAVGIDGQLHSMLETGQPIRLRIPRLRTPTANVFPIHFNPDRLRSRAVPMLASSGAPRAPRSLLNCACSASAAAYNSQYQRRGCSRPALSNILRGKPVARSATARPSNSSGRSRAGCFNIPNGI